VYNSLVGRFPLFDPNEGPPRISHPEERAAFEAKLALRVRDEWDRRVDLSVVPEPLREIVGQMLGRDPRTRLTAKEVHEYCENELAAFLRASEDPSGLSPADELTQLNANLPTSAVLALMPSSQKHHLKNRLRKLREYKGLSDIQRAEVSNLESRLA